MYVGAPVEILVAGRGTGKTTGVLAVKSAGSYFKTMPRSNGAIINATYSQAFSRTLKELIRGWQMLGLKMDHHFVVCRRPTDKWIKLWKWQGPFAPSLDYKYTICWYNGAIAQLFSQDRAGSTNGVSIDWFVGDEAKLLNEEKLKTELFPANRGIIPAFANNPYHHGYTLTTDMPVGTAGRWILDTMSKMDTQKVNDIWQLQLVRFYLKRKMDSIKTKAPFEKQINVIDDELNELRKGLLLYHEASTLDNIHALGVSYIKDQLRDTTQFQFDTQILNLRPLRMEDGFYPDLDEEVHGYFSEESSYFDHTELDILNPVFDCRKDRDIKPDMPLHISMDYNRRIYPLEVAQIHPNEIRVLHSMHVLYPKKIKDVIADFAAYYKPHKRKFVYYWYDQTAVGEQRDTRLCDDVITELRKHKWVVKPMYIGLASSHKSRYETWGDLLNETGKYKKRFRMNRENCKYGILSMQQAEAAQGKDGYQKNKKPETDEKFPAEEATHHSEALDTLIDGILNSGLNYSTTTTAGSGILMGK